MSLLGDMMFSCCDACGENGATNHMNGALLCNHCAGTSIWHQLFRPRTLQPDEPDSTLMLKRALVIRPLYHTA